MALIKCTKCGQMVSDRAEKCPKCGYPVHLSMKQQEETKQSVEPHATTFNTPRGSYKRQSSASTKKQ